jgi:galactosyl transferase GMA12/MNN10 family
MADGYVAVLTGCSSAQRDLLAVSSTINRAYAKKHNYRFISCGFGSDHTGWPKMAAIWQTLQDKANQYVLWIDADAIVTNHEIRAADLVSKYLGAPESALALTCDICGPNTGTMLVKNTPLAQAFFWVCGGVGRFRHQQGCWHEQEAVREFLLYPPYRDTAVYLDQRVMNSYRNDLYTDGRPPEMGAWKKGDFILHLPNVPNETRLRIMREHMGSMGLVEPSIAVAPENLKEAPAERSK